MTLAPPKISKPEVIVLSPLTPVLSLDRRSRFFIEPGGLATPAKVEAAGESLPWSLRQPGAQYNIDGKALWFQFEAVAGDNGRWYLELASSGLDRAQLFYRGPDGNWVVQEAGDTLPVSEWPLPGRVPTFELAHGSEHPVRYFLRAEHARVNFATPLTIYNQASLLASREREQFLLGAYFGLAALIAFITLANAIVHRDRNFAAYAVYVIFLTVGQLAYLGVGAQHIWDRWLHWNSVATFVLPGISTAAALWFARTVTEPARFSRVLDLAVWTLIVGVLAAVAVDTYMASRPTFAVVMGLTVLGLVVVMLLIAMVWMYGDDPYIRLIALGFLPVVIMALFPVARGLNLIPASALTRYGLSIGAALEMPILFYALSLRGSRRREAEVRASALARTDALTGLAHNRSLLARLDAALIRARSQKHACALLVAKLSNLEAIGQEFGREIADRALVVAASILRLAVTDIDLAARVGEYDFALLLEGPTTTENAVMRAQQVVARGLQNSEALPPTVTLKFQIAAALLPDKDFDAPGSLKWLLDAVHAMRPDARRSIRPLNF
ncbi:MAG: 7TM diverse intracellular signaling domain-containing protein [Ramlibacter sp.]